MSELGPNILDVKGSGLGRIWACARVRLDLDTVNYKLILFTPNFGMYLAMRSIWMHDSQGCEEDRHVSLAP